MIGPEIIEDAIISNLIKFEELIDVRLKEQAAKVQPNGSICISTYSIDKHSLQILIEKYKMIGWKSISLFTDTAYFYYDLDKLKEKILKNVTTSEPEVYFESKRNIKLD